MLSFLRYQQDFQFGPTCSFTPKIIRDQSQPSHNKKVTYLAEKNMYLLMESSPNTTCCVWSLTGISARSLLFLIYINDITV